jgi:DNA primase
MDIIKVLCDVLGPYERKSKNNIAFTCPKCKHKKKKLEISLDTYKFHCWVCDYKGTSLIPLFKSVGKYDLYKDILVKISPLKPNQNSSSSTKRVTLPDEFKPLYIKSNDIERNNALKYLFSRNITTQDILKYNIGYCSTGNYRNCIIIPSYDANQSLNYFTAKNYYSGRYINPSIDRNIIPFELYINWDIPIILCEGMFDAITIKRNVIPLLGKTLSKSLLIKLMESQVNKIYICLDNDAIKQAIKFCEMLLKNGKKVYLVELDGKDPNDIGIQKFRELIETIQPLTFQQLIQKKIELL